MERRNVHIFGNCYIKEDLLAKTNNQRVHSIIGVLSSLELYYFFFLSRCYVRVKSSFYNLVKYIRILEN
jgi:hypothetical protein